MTRSTLRHGLGRVLTLVVGSAGLRIDRPLRQVLLTAFLLAATIPLHLLAAHAGFAVACALAAGVVYYGGNATLCSRGVSGRLRARLGAGASIALHEVFLGVAFAHQALALSCVARATGGSFALPAQTLLLVAGLLTLLGAGVKYWATHLVGLDVYYYRDLFLRRPVGPIVRTGPYRYLAHPMYGVGNLHSYVPALVAGSTSGLVVALGYHLAVFGFLILVERPFFDSIAGSEAQPR